MTERDAVMQRLDELEAEVAALRAGQAAAPPQPRFGRRHLLTAAAGVAAGTVLATAKPAAADDGDPLLLGSENTAESDTTLTSTSSFVLDVTGEGDGAFAAIRAAAPHYGVFGTGGFSGGWFESSAPAGEVGFGVTGVTSYGIPVVGVIHTAGEPVPSARFPALIGIGEIPGSFGLQLEGKRSHMVLVPMPVAGVPDDERDDGELLLDADGEIHVCHAGGTPGTWHRLLTNRTETAAAAGAVHMLDQAFRLYDSRAGQNAALSGPKGKLVPGTTRTLKVTDTEPFGGGQEVPDGALAALCTIQAIDATGTGYLRAYRPGTTPSATTLSWASRRAITTTFVRLSDGGSMSIRAFTSAGDVSANVVIDVLGWIA